MNSKIAGGVAFGLVVLVAGGLWLQPRTSDEALCYWLQKQLDGSTSVLDKVACKRQAVEAAEIRQEQEAEREAQRQRDEEQRRQEQTAFEADSQRRRDEAATEQRVREACLDETDEKYRDTYDALEDEWQTYNAVPADQTEEEFEALMREFERVDAELQDWLVEWQEAESRCWG